MRKILFAFIALFCLQIGLSYALEDCSDLDAEYTTVKEQVTKKLDAWKALRESDQNREFQWKILSDLLSKWVKLENAYNDCLAEFKKINDTIDTYFDLGDNYFEWERWDRAIGQYRKVLEIDPDSYRAYFNIGSAYLNNGKYEESFKAYKQSYNLAQWRSQTQEAKDALSEVEDLLKENGAEIDVRSDDTFSHLQYYLDTLHIPEAWDKIPNNPKEVVVAVIDDGVNINHPDLTEHIWIDSNAPYGSSKIKDFVGDNLPDNLPSGEHGTMISGIIGATTDNKRWIAGIAKNVKIMPLRVFDFKGNAREENIIKAMNYAINHNANIINLSLGQSQFSYSSKYDDAMKKAYDNGIIVVVAAGNGDVLSYSSTGVNTTVNPLSPVCNNGWSTKYSIGVESLDQKWIRARWSNYGVCIAFAAPGEDIFSTSVGVFNKDVGTDYETSSGTSFSAPMIAGVIALGYNKYGYVSPDTVYRSLNESLEINSVWNYVINASRYLDVLSKKSSIILKEQQNKKNNSVWNNKISNSKDNSLALKNSNDKNISDSDFLAQEWIITKQKNLADYHLGDFVKREEVVATAVKMLNIYIPDDYTCHGTYDDLSATRPNNWACRVMEIASEKWLITIEWTRAKPEEYITLVETLNIFLKVGGIKVEQYTGGEFEPWQNNIIGTAFRKGIIDISFRITSANKKTIRSDLFRIARKIYQLQVVK